MKRNGLLALTFILALCVLAPSVQAIDLDPGDGGSSAWTLTIQVKYIKLANDGDLFSDGEVYMKNPGTVQYWPEYKVLEGSVAGGVAKQYTVPYTVKTTHYVTADNIGDRFSFQLKDSDRVIDSTLWSGYVKLKALIGCTITDWNNGNTIHDFSAVRIVGLTSAYTEYGSGTYIRNQMHFTITLKA